MHHDKSTLWFVISRKTSRMQPVQWIKLLSPLIVSSMMTCQSTREYLVLSRAWNAMCCTRWWYDTSSYLAIDPLCSQKNQWLSIKLYIALKRIFSITKRFEKVVMAMVHVASTRMHNAHMIKQQRVQWLFSMRSWTTWIVVISPPLGSARRYGWHTCTMAFILVLEH